MFLTRQRRQFWSTGEQARFSPVPVPDCRPLTNFWRATWRRRPACWHLWWFRSPSFPFCKLKLIKQIYPTTSSTFEDDNFMICMFFQHCARLLSRKKTGKVAEVKFWNSKTETSKNAAAVECGDQQWNTQGAQSRLKPNLTENNRDETIHNFPK